MVLKRKVIRTAHNIMSTSQKNILLYVSMLLLGDYVIKKCTWNLDVDSVFQASTGIWNIYTKKPTVETVLLSSPNIFNMIK